MNLRAKAIQAIQSMSKGIDMLSEKQWISSKAVKIQTEQLNHVIDYINDLDQQNKEKAAFIEKLLKVCAVFDIHVPFVLSHNTEVVNAMLLLKKERDMNWIDEQELVWGNGLMHVLTFNENSVQRMDNQLADMLKKKNPQAYASIVDFEDEEAEYTKIQMHSRANMSENILMALDEQCDFQLEKYIEIK